MERIDRGLSVAGVLREQAEVVPGVRILGILLERCFERGFGFVDLLQVQVGDAFIQACDRQFRIKLRRLLEALQSLLEKLLVHIGGAQIVQARGLGGIRFRLRGRGEEAKGGKQYASQSC